MHRMIVHLEACRAAARQAGHDVIDALTASRPYLSEWPHLITF